MPSSGPAPASRGAETPTPPDWHCHGLNRLGYYRLATAAGALPRPARLLLARGFGRLFALVGARPAVIEGVIRAYPTQWFNFFDAWSPPHDRA